MSKKICTYGRLEKKIARCLAQLPSDYLQTLAKTQEQVCLWLDYRDFQKALALCGQARHTGKDHPLISGLRSGDVDPDLYDRCWLMVDHYEQLWGLIQLSATHVQAEFDLLGLEYPFESAFELFAQIVTEGTNEAFSVCLKPYHEVSGRKYSKAYRLASKACKTGTLNPIELKQQRGLLNQHQPSMLMNITLAVCHSKATRRRPALKSKLEMFFLTLGKLSDLEASLNRKAGSFAWKDGEIVKARLGGTYAEEFENPPSTPLKA